MIYTSREVYEYISRQTNDPIVEWKTCAVSGTQFPIFQSDLDFYAKISPTFAGQKFAIPTPTLCPEERQRRRLSFRNERKLYRRQCDASKKSIISIYSPDKPYKVYDQKIRWSDARDPMDYGMDFDFSKTFTEQFGELMRKVPRLSSGVYFSENCEYGNYVMSCKDSYLIFASIDSKNCLYGRALRRNDECIDNYQLIDSILCYNIMIGGFNHKVYNGYHVFNCKNSQYLYYCDNCDYCLGCTNLINAKYCILNKQYSKEEYERIVKEIDYNFIWKEFKELIKGSVNISRNMINNEGFCGNDFIRNSKNCLFGYNLSGCHSTKYCNEMEGSEDSFDCDIGIGNARKTYNTTAIGRENEGVICSSTVSNCNNILYSMNCVDYCSNLFGCIGLRNKSYCIFNKQYTKEEYEELVGRIIRHMMSTGERGEFFHPSLSPFGYNETVAQEYYPVPHTDPLPTAPATPPLGEGELRSFGYHRSSYNADPTIPEGVQTIERKNYSDEQRNSLLQEDNLETKVFLCSVSARPYRLQKAEIEFYRKHQLPIPDKHPDIRHEERMKLRPGRTLFLRTCDCCSKEMLSVYNQDHEGKVYCEECYTKEVYG